MLSMIDLIIIEGFLSENAEKFNQFCIDECLGTSGTGKAITDKSAHKEITQK